MRKFTIYCDKCGREVTGIKYQIACVWTDLPEPSDDEWDIDKGADLCECCFKECDDMIAWFVKNPGNHFTYPTVKAETKKKNINHGTKQRKKDLDLGKIAALRNAGWSFDKIGEEVGCSGVTIAKHMAEAQEFLRQKNLPEDLAEALEDDIQEV